jgi:peroxiredoxin Q/BCP
MSKKTRTKSSKPAPKSRKTPAPKPSAAKTTLKAARKTAGRSDTTSAKKPAAKATNKATNKTAKSAAKAAVGKPEKTAKTASTKASHKPPSKSLKSNLSAPPKPNAGTELVEGAMAPPFSLPRDGGGSVSLADYAGKKLVLFFYPRADTPGCTKEAIDFTRLKGAFASAGTEVLGISADSLSAQERFRDKHKLAVPLISDEKHQMLEAYGAWGEKSMYGRTFLGILRTTVLIGADGRVARVWRHVKVDGHADAVLEAVEAT